MDEQERKKYPSLPPDYVTIAMLRERWLHKQEEQNLDEKQEQEVLEETQNLENGCQNQPHEELGVCHRFENNGPRKSVEKYDREMALIEEKGKGKEIKIGCYGNGKVTNNKYHRKNKKFGADWKKGNGDILKVNMEDREKRQNPRAKEGLDLDEKKNGFEGVDIAHKTKVKVGIAGFLSGETGGTEVIGEIGSVKMTEVLPKDGVKVGGSESSTAQNVRRVGFRGGFRANENNREAGFRSKEYRVKVRELKDNNSLEKKEDKVLEIDRKGNGRTRRWQKRRGKGDKFKQSRADMRGLKLNEVELKSEDEIWETGSERDGMKGLHSSKGRNDIKQNRVNGKALTADTVLLENKAENTALEDTSRSDGFRGYGDWRGNLRENFENFTIDDRKGHYLESKVERRFGGNRRHVNSRRFEVDRKMKQRESGMVWVQKEQSGAVAGEVGSMGVPLINSS